MSLPIEKQFLEAIDKSTHVLVAIRRDWTPDGIASGLALRSFIEKRGKRVDIVAEGFDAAKSLKFLPGVNFVRGELQQLQKFIVTLDLARTKIGELSYDLAGDKLHIHVTPKQGQFDAKDVTTSASDFKHDLIVTVGVPDYPALGAVFTDHPDFFYKTPVVNIDCDAGNERYGNLNLIDITGAATAEVAYRLLESTGEPHLNHDTATCLLTGLIGATRSFKSPDVTPKTLEVASQLIAAGARREEIVSNLYRTRSIATLKLWGRALARLKIDLSAKFAWSLLVRTDFVHAGATEECVADVIDELIANSPEADIAGVIYEQADPNNPNHVGSICALIASEKHADVGKLVAALRPAGHRRMARICFPDGDLLAAENAVLNSIYKSLGKVRATPDAAVVLPELAAALSGAGSGQLVSRSEDQRTSQPVGNGQSVSRPEDQRTRGPEGEPTVVEEKAGERSRAQEGERSSIAEKPEIQA